MGVIETCKFGNNWLIVETEKSETGVQDSPRANLRCNLIEL